MTNLKKAKVVSILILLFIIGIAITSFAQSSGIATEDIKLRKTTSTNSTVLEIIPKNEEVEILEEDGDWYRVDYKKIKGYVAKEYIKLNETSSNETNTIQENTVQENLYTKDQPDPDLVIRTSGEERISNFLLWQIAYSELLFVQKNWPDFNEEDLDKAIIEYKKRTRKFGAN